MNDFIQEYASKKMTPEEIGARIVCGDRIFNTSDPYLLQNALADRYEELHDVEIYVTSVQGGSKLFDPAVNGHIKFCSIFMGATDRAARKKGREIYYCGGHLSDVGNIVKYGMHPTKYFAQVSPMDENGYFSLGYCSYGGMEAIEAGAELYLQVNDQFPVVFGESNTVHISQVAGLTECSTPFKEMPEIPISPEDQTIADFVLDRIEDGSTIQIGIGAVANAVAYGLRDRKHLGIHTELFVPSMIDLIECGAVDNSLKTTDPGKTVIGFATGTEKMCKYLHRNPDIEVKRISYINSQETIAKQYKFVSINGCLSVDLHGQVYSEAIGPVMYSGSGGQYDFVRGSKQGHGQSFLTMHSITKDHTSKISFAQPEGSIVTDLRNDVHMIVTEYGVADLLWKTAPDRTRALIAIAHPDFRDELTFQAKKAGLIY